MRPKRTIITPLFAALQQGHNVSAACRHAGLPRRTFYSWLRRDRAFASAVERAMTEPGPLIGPPPPKSRRNWQAPRWSDREGYVYAVQLWPDIAPQRIKVGWSAALAPRLAVYRGVAPDLVLLGAWPAAAATAERDALEALRAVPGVRSLTRELFDGLAPDQAVDTITSHLGPPGLRQ